MDIDTNGRGIAQIDDDEPPTCELCGCEYTMETGDEPTPFCDRCAHDVLAEQSTTLARLTAEVEAMRAELATVRDELAKCADAVGGYFDDGDSVSDTVQVVADALGHAKAAERGLTAERDALQRHFDAASPEHNLPALLDLYFERQQKAERERDEARFDVRAYQKRCADFEISLDAAEKERDEARKERDASRRVLPVAVENALAQGRAAGLREAAEMSRLVEVEADLSDYAAAAIALTYGDGYCAGAADAAEAYRHRILALLGPGEVES